MPAQPALFRTTVEYRCPLHRIYVSASTFAYEREADNLLWTRDTDLLVLHGGRRLGRDLGLARDNSERAVTWNVFRWLESAGVLESLVEGWTGRSAAGAEVIYWGYSPERDGCWLPLLRARNAFGEDETDATEPAVLIDADATLFAVDPRLATGSGTPRSTAGWERYEEGGRGWAETVLTGRVRGLAADRGRFELLRLWLVGTYMAEQAGKNFVLLHTVPSWSRGPSLADLQPHLRLGADRVAMRVTWEDVHAFVTAEHPTARDAPALLTYLEEKSAGYGPDGVLRRAFSLGYAAPASTAGSAGTGVNPKSSNTSRTVMN